jgi:protein-L-isoaspartate(D-aspartate) O-methyltransferase
MLQKNQGFNRSSDKGGVWMNADSRAEERHAMVERQIASRGITNRRILATMKQIPRHFFIPPPYDRDAYDDNPLPIGNGQTISQPYIVALMTDLLYPEADNRILEIGAGSGYQAAILAALAKKVITIERIPAVADMARTNLAKLGITNANLIIGDGTIGYPTEAPYNGIIITAATPTIPQPLIDQLAEGGRLVAPVGGRDVQELVRLNRIGNRITESHHGGVRFVPLIGEHGWNPEIT